MCINVIYSNSHADQVRKVRYIHMSHNAYLAPPMIPYDVRGLTIQLTFVVSGNQSQGI